VYYDVSLSVGVIALRARERDPETMKMGGSMRAPGRSAWKRGTKLKRGAATQIVTYPRPQTKSALVEASRQLGVSLSSLLIGSGLGVAAKLAGCSITDLVPKAELLQYMRGRQSDRVATELWDSSSLSTGTATTSTGTSTTTDVVTGGTMAIRTDSILELEDRAKKIEALAALLRDPALDDVVSKLFGETHASATTNPSPHRNCDSLPTAITEAIREVASELPQPFTVTDVVRRLKERQFVFRRSALDATRDALYRLSRGKRSTFRILEIGQGGKPNKYTLKS
jgi:hypothetical protein